MWANGLSNGIRQVDGAWITDPPMGEVRVQFVGDITAGILDHDVTLPGGEKIHNPMRVLTNDAGSEVVFTLYRRPEMTDEEFEVDKGMIVADLERLGSILELP